MTFLSIIAAYILVDAISGVYHFLTDKGWNIPNQCKMFAEHHDTNTMANFDWQTFAVALPIVGVGAWFHSPFWIACGVFGALTQVTHYYAHVRSGSLAVHRIVRALQGWLSGSLAIGIGGAIVGGIAIYLWFVSQFWGAFGP